MLERSLAGVNRWVLDHVSPQWVDFVASNTMTDLNRRINRFIWTYELKAQVVEVRDEAPDVKTFVMRPNQLWRGMKPGQYVELVLPLADASGASLRRHYSATLLPRGRFSLTVKRLANGRASRWMHEHLQPGSVVELGATAGRFCHQGQARVLFVAAGSGITPVHSMVEALLQQPAAERPDMQVVGQFRTPDDVIFKAAQQAWARAGVKVSTVFSQQAAGEARVARVDARLLEALCPDLRERDIYLCGPDGFMAEMIDGLRELGVDLTRVHTERFAPAKPPAGGPANSEETFDTEGACVHFRHVGASLDLTAADRGKTFLQIAQDHGLNLESGCGQGMCGTCKLTLHEGEVRGNQLGCAVYLCTAYPGSREVVLGG